MEQSPQALTVQELLPCTENNASLFIEQKTHSEGEHAEVHQKRRGGKDASVIAPKIKSLKVESKTSVKQEYGVSLISESTNIIKLENGNEDSIHDSKPSLFLNLKEGQKFPSPPVGDGTRAFYESLLKEKNDSIMAIKFCIEYGILIGTQRKEVYRRYCALKQLGAFKKVGGIKKDILAQADEYLKNPTLNNKSTKPSVSNKARGRGVRPKP